VEEIRDPLWLAGILDRDVLPMAIGLLLVGAGHLAKRPH